MMRRLLQVRQPNRLLAWMVVGGVLLAAILLSRYLTYYQEYVLILLLAGLGAVLLMLRPVLGLPMLVFAALLVPFEVGTGTSVPVHKVTLLLPVLLFVWFMDMLHRREVRVAPSRTNRPLFLFLVSGLLSLIIGKALWDPAVPYEVDFLIVQLAQWAIFALSAAAFWLAGNLVRDEAWLRRLTFSFLAFGGGLAILRALPFTAALADRMATIALHRAPFWMLLAALAGGQLLFNRKLSPFWRLFSGASLVAALVYAVFVEQESASSWISLAVVFGVLVWLRFPRLRLPALIAVAVLAASGLLTSALYQFAGGDAEWQQSGLTRIALIGRTVEVSLRNPITGLGPAAYRAYARVEPISIQGAYYFVPWISSHNNYVDLFSHVGLLGIALLFWFAAEVARLGTRLRAQFSHGFAAGYVNGVLAAGVGALVLMLLADWILPFVYNIGFPGFQASVLVWLFLGGLGALEQIASKGATV